MVGGLEGVLYFMIISGSWGRRGETFKKVGDGGGFSWRLGLAGEKVLKLVRRPIRAGSFFPVDMFFSFGVNKGR